MFWVPFVNFNIKRSKKEMMKKLFSTLALLLVLAVGTFAQNPQQQSYLHRVGNIYFSIGYSSYNAIVLSGNTTTGAGTSIIVFAQGVAGVATLADGAAVPLTTVFNTTTPITIADANQETFTPSGVSIGSCPAGNLGVGSSNQCATITGTIANTHGQSAAVTSGDFGIREAITDAGAQGGGLVFWQVDTGIVTLNTGGLTTTTTTFVPTNFYGMGASARVTTTITTSTNWATGISGSTSAFTSVNTGLTAGTISTATQLAPASIGTTSTLTAILFTVTGANAGAGAIKARVWGWTPVQAAS
jgi:hypothetical protein